MAAAAPAPPDPHDLPLTQRPPPDPGTMYFDDPARGAMDDETWERRVAALRGRTLHAQAFAEDTGTGLLQVRVVFRDGYPELFNAPMHGQTLHVSITRVDDEWWTQLRWWHWERLVERWGGGVPYAMQVAYAQGGILVLSHQDPLRSDPHFAWLHGIGSYSNREPHVSL